MTLTAEEMDLLAEKIAARIRPKMTLTSEDVAAELNCSRQYVDILRRQGKLRAVLFCFLLSADDQGMRHSVHTDKDVIRITQLVGKAALFEGDSARRDVVFGAQIAIGAAHTFVATDDNCAHKPSCVTVLVMPNHILAYYNRICQVFCKM